MPALYSWQHDESEVGSGWCLSGLLLIPSSYSFPTLQVWNGTKSLGERKVGRTCRPAARPEGWNLLGCMPPTTEADIHGLQSFIMVLFGG